MIRLLRALRLRLLFAVALSYSPAQVGSLILNRVVQNRDPATALRSLSSSLLLVILLLYHCHLPLNFVHIYLLLVQARSKVLWFTNLELSFGLLGGFTQYSHSILLLIALLVIAILR